MLIDTDKFKKTEYTTLVITFLGGLLVHLFGLVNIIHNSDDIHCHPTGYGAGVPSGRWMLTLMGNFLKWLGMNYNLNWVNGVVFIGFIAISAGVLVMLFQIKSRQMAALVGLILVSFPTVCSTMLYKYTAGYYGFAFLLSVLAVWVLPKFNLWGFVISASFTAISMGIYQAYLPFTIAVFVLQLIQKSIKEDINFKRLFYYGIYICLSLILGLALYYLGVKLSLNYYHTKLNAYQGINNMGNISLMELPGLIVTAYRNFLAMPVIDYCNLAPNKLLKVAYLLLYVIDIGLICLLILVKKMKVGNAVMCSLLCLVFPVAVNFIHIMCPNSRIYTLMVFACAVPVIMPAVLIELLPKDGKHYAALTKCAVIVLLTIIYSNAYFTNVTYSSTYYVNRQTENYMTSMISQIRMIEGFDTEKEWVFIGKNTDTMIDNPWQEVPIYGGAEDTNRMVSAYSWKDWISVYLGYSISVADTNKASEIINLEEVRNMPTWPAEGSVKVVNDVIVIKFQSE